MLCIRERQLELSSENRWGMALYSFMQSVETITELAKSEPYRTYASDDFTRIAEATLAVNLMWSQLEARRHKLAAAE